jgi:A/G-specific adenine glycosylase
MLQQTRVETVVPYFERFLARWPTLTDLAQAEEEAVLQAWAGLGYYRRARALHAVAKAAVARGGLPGTVEELLALPGIGPYTAGAIASLGFGQRVPLVDGNVERVLSRVDGREEDPRSTFGKRALWARAQAIVEASPAPAGVINQALMELGATTCQPRRVACPACPWQERCVARSSADPTRLPNLKPKAPPRPEAGHAVLVREGDRLLLARRARHRRLGGLWEPPLVVDPAGRWSDQLQEQLGLTLHVEHLVGQVVHVFTHRRLSVSVYAARRVVGDPSPCEAYDRIGWFTLEEAEQLGLSTLARKLMALEPALPFAVAAEPPG